MAKIAVFTGAGISAESGLKTFRDSDGLWEGFNIEDVATPGAWHRSQETVLRFYNERRRQGRAAAPNAAHFALTELEVRHEVQIITQNIDDLHERAGSKNVLHLHGQVKKSQSTVDSNLIFDIEGEELNIGDLCPLGSQLRPFVVWFGEAVPMFEPALDLVRRTDILLIVGTSLAVYPAASLISCAPRSAQIIVVDRKRPEAASDSRIEFIMDDATSGVRKVVDRLLS